MVYFISSKTVVIGAIYPEIYHHIQQSFGITKTGVRMALSNGLRHNYMTKCANKSKKPQLTTLIMIDSQAVKILVIAQDHYSA